MQKNQKMTTKTLAVCALLAALNIVLARLIGLMPNASTRFSIEAVPVFLAGALFGPMAGAMVGFSSDMIGCLFTPFGYNPIFSVPPILYGLCGGIFRTYLMKHTSMLRLLFAYLVPVVLGSILYQSITLTVMFFDGSFREGLAFYLSTRSLQFSVVLVLDAVVTDLLFRANLFQKMGLWPVTAKTEKGNIE